MCAGWRRAEEEDIMEDSEIAVAWFKYSVVLIEVALPAPCSFQDFSFLIKYKIMMVSICTGYH